MVQNIKPNELIEKTAIELKKIPEIKPPVWSVFVKTGVNKERPPLRNDWWYVRAAAVLRSVYLRGPMGVSKLRTKYGSKRNMGYKPDRVYKGSGNILRKILQQLEKAGLLIEEKKGVHKGRKVTKKGKEFLDNISKQIKPVVIGKKKEEKVVEKPKEEVKKVEKKEPAEEVKEKPVEKKPKVIEKEEEVKEKPAVKENKK